MKKQRLLFSMVAVIIGLLISLPAVSQVRTDHYKVRAGESQTILIENGQLYRITIKSCWYSAEAFIGTYLIYGLNTSDPKTNGKPKVLVVAETPQIDWVFRYRLTGQYDTKMEIESQGLGDQGLLIVIEKLSTN